MAKGKGIHNDVSDIINQTTGALEELGKLLAGRTGEAVVEDVSDSIVENVPKAVKKGVDKVKKTDVDISDKVDITADGVKEKTVKAVSEPIEEGLEEVPKKLNKGKKRKVDIAEVLDVDIDEATLNKQFKSITSKLYKARSKRNVSEDFQGKRGGDSEARKLLEDYERLLDIATKLNKAIPQTLQTFAADLKTDISPSPKFTGKDTLADVDNYLSRITNRSEDAAEKIGQVRQEVDRLISLGNFWGADNEVQDFEEEYRDVLDGFSTFREQTENLHDYIQENYDAFKKQAAEAEKAEEATERLNKAYQEMEGKWVRNQTGNMSDVLNSYTVAINKIKDIKVTNGIDKEGNEVTTTTSVINYDKLLKEVLNTDKQILDLEYKIKNARGDTTPLQNNLNILKEEQRAYQDIISELVSNPDMYNFDGSQAQFIQTQREIQEQTIRNNQAYADSTQRIKDMSQAESEMAKAAEKANKELADSKLVDTKAEKQLVILDGMRQKLEDNAKLSSIYSKDIEELQNKLSNVGGDKTKLAQYTAELNVLSAKIAQTEKGFAEFAKTTQTIKVDSIQGIEAILESINSNGLDTHITQQLNDFLDRYNAFKTALQSSSTGIISEADRQQIASFGQEIGGLKQVAVDTANALKQMASIDDIASAQTRMESWLSSSKKLSDGTRRSVVALMNALQPGATTKAELASISKEFINIQRSAKMAGETGRTFFDIWKQGATNLVRYATTFASFYRLAGYVREAVTTIQDLDYALVDLRKTSSMTNRELEDFYLNSSNIAKQTGNTTEEIINQAAAWSRLGYSTNEAATEMAALSSQFAAISPGMSLDKATDGLVSTMKAFHIDVQDVEREVMDSVNRIGKYKMPKHTVMYGAIIMIA